jgi:hypothetical protein
VNRLFSLYVSTRFVGDIKGTVRTEFGPGYLSESSFILGAGISSHTWHHMTAWAEAGESIKYLESRKDIGAAIPDYRGGLNFAKGFGTLLGSKSSGFYYETTADVIYVTRFDKDWLFYSQNRAGRTFSGWAGSSVQTLLNLNFVYDTKNEYWAETAEIGPGVRVHLAWMPTNVFFVTDLLRGVYLNNTYNPRRPNYNDLRVGFWYAVTK